LYNQLTKFTLAKKYSVPNNRNRWPRAVHTEHFG